MANRVKLEDALAVLRKEYGDKWTLGAIKERLGNEFEQGIREDLDELFGSGKSILVYHAKTGPEQSKIAQFNGGRFANLEEDIILLAGSGLALQVPIRMVRFVGLSTGMITIDTGE